MRAECIHAGEGFNDFFSNSSLIRAAFAATNGHA